MTLWDAMTDTLQGVDSETVDNGREWEDPAEVGELLDAYRLGEGYDEEHERQV